MTHWEYWPFGIVYIPMYFVWFYYSLRARSFFFFNASNPSIRNGGFLMESKKEIYDLLPAEFYPKTVLARPGEALTAIRAKYTNLKMSFPLIAKPDIGMRGMAVQKLENEEDLAAYINKVDFDFLIQEYVDLPNEIGIFYVRFPNKEKGKITGIVAKEFLIVVGDGRSNIQALVEKNPRYHLQMNALQKMYGSRLMDIPAPGERINLVPYGNHARGSRFVNATSWANVKLTAVLNRICLQVPHFHYGRLDIKYNTIEELENGQNLSIIELNGAGSEPTHIYDPGQSIFTAWKEIVRHFSMLFKISKINHQNGHRFMTFFEGLDMLRQNKLHVKKLERF
ncbi:D-alanine--D-alanine ligase [Dyadobacter sp. UC 10]|nr:D-alanine--D-alanine ligase [Dyadobacter sp. UC 10]